MAIIRIVQTPEERLSTLTFSDAIKDFHGAIQTLSACAPDELRPYMSSDYAGYKEWVFESWTFCKPRLKRDADKIEAVERLLNEAFVLLDGYQAALDRGESPAPLERQKGRDLLWEIWKMKPERFR